MKNHVCNLLKGELEDLKIWIEAALSIEQLLPEELIKDNKQIHVLEDAKEIHKISPCKICGALIKFDEIEEHTNKHKQNEEVIVNCDICEARVKFEEYALHMLIHLKMLQKKASSEAKFEIELPTNEHQFIRTPFDGKGEEKECPICLCNYETSEALIYLPCMHPYHEKCIIEWLQRSPTCPNCSKQVYKVTNTM